MVMVNLTEKYIEDAFAESMRSHARMGEGYIDVWQQVTLPTGKVDIVAVEKHGPSHLRFTVVEVKKGKADYRAFTQLLGYLNQVTALAVSSALHQGAKFDWELQGHEPFCYGVLVADGIDDLTRRALRYSRNIGHSQYYFDDSGINFVGGLYDRANMWHGSCDQRIRPWIHQIAQQFKTRIEETSQHVFDNGLLAGRQLSEYQELPY